MPNDDRALGILERITKFVTGQPPDTVQKAAIVTNDQLPEDLQARLPLEAQDRWRRAYNEAYVDRDLNEARATEAAWQSLRWDGWHEGPDGMYQQIRKGDAGTDGRVIKTESERRYTLGVVYEPGVVDSQGDFATAPEIEKAAHHFLERLQTGAAVKSAGLRVLQAIKKAAAAGDDLQLDVTGILDVPEDLLKGGVNDEHINTPFDDTLGTVVESYVAPADMTLEGQPVKKGSWLVGVVWSPDYFELIKAGKRTGYSMEGKGKRLSRDRTTA